MAYTKTNMMLDMILDVVASNPEIALLVGVLPLAAYLPAAVGDRLFGQPRDDGDFDELRTTQVKRLYLQIGVLALIGLTAAGAWQLNLI
jgi:hypothetical protein